MQQQGAETIQERVSRLRKLNEGEKLSLIFTQQRRLGEYEKRIEAFECSHLTGQCPLCRDKDLQITQLQQQIEQLKDKLYGRSSERSNSGKRNNSGSGDSTDESGESSPSRTRLPSDQFPDARIEEVTVEDPVPPKCSECAEAMTDSGLRETSERVGIQPAELYIIRSNRVRYHCDACQCGGIKTASLPQRLAPGTSMDDSFIIQACISKFYDLIPDSRFAKILGRGQKTATKVSENLLRKAQRILVDRILIEICLAIKNEIIESKVANADETIHRQLEDNDGNWRWYLWGFCTITSVYFEIHDTRAADVSIEFLKDSKVEFLVSDAYTGYGRTIREINEVRTGKGQPLLQSCLCNDHSRRYWFKAQAAPLAKTALELYNEIYGIEEKVQELLSRSINEPENTRKALELRQTSDPIFNEIYNKGCEILLDAPEKSPEAIAARYFINNIKGLTLFLRHIELPISNAFAERTIRGPVILRKISLGNHSQQGAINAAISLSVMGSCKACAVNPADFLEFNKNRKFDGKPLLTPYQYKLYLDSIKKRDPPDSS